MLRRCCPICGQYNIENKKVFCRKFTGMCDMVPFEEYDVYQCEQCGLVYAGNIVEGISLEKYYTDLSKYERPGWAELELVSKLDQEAAEFLDKNISIGKDASILDIGCGAGGLLYALKKMGYLQVFGLEPSVKNAKFAREHYNVMVYPEGLNANITVLSGRKFDVISMKGVLEHILLLKDSIEIALTFLGQDGKFFIEVPDVSLFRYQENLYQEFSVEHVNFFNIASLNSLFQIFGFKLEAYQQNKKHCNVMTVWSRNERCVVPEYSVEVVKKYLEKSNRLSQMVVKKIDNIKDDFYIWGAGTHTAMLYQLGCIKDSQVLGIIDMNRNYMGKLFYGHHIILPSNILSEAPILISSQDAQDEIEKCIKEDLHLQNPIIVLYPK